VYTKDIRRAYRLYAKVDQATRKQSGSVAPLHEGDGNKTMRRGLRCAMLPRLNWASLWGLKSEDPATLRSQFDKP
jgi:hypothetical protein